VLASFLAWNRDVLSSVDLPDVGVLAIDITTVPYFGEDRTHVVRAKEYRGTQCCFQLATVYLCHRGMRFTLHALPVDQLTRKEDVVRALLEEAMRSVRPTLVLMDRGFYAAEVVRVLLDLGVDFLIPAPRTAAVRRVLKETRHLYAWVGRHVVGDRGPEVTLAVVPARNATEQDERFPYITRRTVDTAAARSLADLYDARWGIETWYRVMKDTGPWTTSNAYAVRLLYDLLMVVLYNVWVLLNARLQPASFDERRLVRMEDFLDLLLDAVRFRRRPVDVGA
jgi:IS4 transposase